MRHYSISFGLLNPAMIHKRGLQWRANSPPGGGVGEDWSTWWTEGSPGCRGHRRNNHTNRAANPGLGCIISRYRDIRELRGSMEDQRGISGSVAISFGGFRWLFYGRYLMTKGRETHSRRCSSAVRLPRGVSSGLGTTKRGGYVQYSFRRLHRMYRCNGALGSSSR